MATGSNNAASNNKSELTEALGEARTALVNGVKASAGNSAKLAIGVGVAAFALQLTILAAVGAYGAGEGVLNGIKNARTTS